jgi:hypothetical protein
MKNRFVSVKNHEGLLRDNTTGAIINKDKSGYESYMANRERLANEKEKIKNLENNVEELKTDISDIKSLLLKFIEDKNN